MNGHSDEAIRAAQDDCEDLAERLQWEQSCIMKDLMRLGLPPMNEKNSDAGETP